MVDINEKICFVIAPIGENGSETRERSDLVLDHIIQPAVESFGYKAVRADNIDRPGIITTQVIQYVLDAHLVIADLTERNPNVFYELAIRHITRKPFIQIMQEGEGIPFDIAATRIIPVDHNHLGKAAEAREKIKAQIESLEANPQDLETPISTSVDLQRLRHSNAPEERSLADSLSIVIRTELSNLAELVNMGSGNINEREIRQIIHEVMSAAGLSNPRQAAILPREIPTIILYSRSLYGFLIALSVFRERVPWIYELGMEVYRQAEEGRMEKATEIFRELTRLIDLAERRLPRQLMFATRELAAQFERIIEDDLPF